MDNFIDKLAQKFNAQEIIRANSAAETEEKNKLQEQVKEYQECLSQMRDVSKELKRMTDRMEKQLGEISGEMEGQLRQNALGLEKMLKERIEHLSDEAVSRMEESGNECLAKIEAVQRDLEDGRKLQEEIETLSAHLDDMVHKENVKVYRNVQAVVQDETAKQTESLESAVKGLGGRLSAVLGISIASLIGVIGLIVYQVLLYLHIL